jgi:hypothetical protein
MRLASPTSASRSRLGRLASSSASVGTRTILQCPRSPRSQPRKPRFRSSASSRSVFARRCSRVTATLDAYYNVEFTPLGKRCSVLWWGKYATAGVRRSNRRDRVELSATRKCPDQHCPAAGRYATLIRRSKLACTVAQSFWPSFRRRFS